LSFNFFASGQFEGQSKKKLPRSLVIIDNNPKEEIAEQSEENKESNLFEIKKPPKTLLEWRKKKPNFSFGQIDTEFVKPKYKIKTGLEQKEGAWREEYKKDQNFGDFKTESKTVKIICRDHEYVDGDRVMILMKK
jgi:hypothetical protein